MFTPYYQDWAALPVGKSTLRASTQDTVPTVLQFHAPGWQVVVEWSALGQSLLFLNGSLVLRDASPVPTDVDAGVQQTLERLQRAFPQDGPARIQALALMGRYVAPKARGIVWTEDPDGWTPAAKVGTSTLAPVPGAWQALLSGIHTNPMQPMISRASQLAPAPAWATAHQRLADLELVRDVFARAGLAAPI